MSARLPTYIVLWGDDDQQWLGPDEADEPRNCSLFYNVDDAAEVAHANRGVVLGINLVNKHLDHRDPQCPERSRSNNGRCWRNRDHVGKHVTLEPDIHLPAEWEGEAQPMIALNSRILEAMREAAIRDRDGF